MEKGAVPPLAVLNDFLACGVDDVAEDIGCLDVDMRGDRGAVMEWEPFTLTQTEYDGLLAYIRSRGKAIVVREIGDGTYREWFGRLFL